MWVYEKGGERRWRCAENSAKKCIAIEVTWTAHRHTMCIFLPLSWKEKTTQNSLIFRLHSSAHANWCETRSAGIHETGAFVAVFVCVCVLVRVSRYYQTQVGIEEKNRKFVSFVLFLLPTTTTMETTRKQQTSCQLCLSNSDASTRLAQTYTYSKWSEFTGSAKNVVILSHLWLVFEAKHESLCVLFLKLFQCQIDLTNFCNMLKHVLFIAHAAWIMIIISWASNGKKTMMKSKTNLSLSFVVEEKSDEKTREK